MRLFPGLAALPALSALVALAALGALLASPGAAAAVTGFEAEATVPAGERASWPLDGGEGDGLLLSWDSDVPVDLLVVQADNASALDDAAAEPRLAGTMLNESSGRGHVTLSAPGPWLLVLDNTAGPPGGAAGLTPATARVTVAPYLLEVPDPSGEEPAPQQEGGADGGEAPTLWNTLLFDSWKWVPGGVVGFGGVALWAFVALAAACFRFGAPLRVPGQLVAGATAFVTVWSLLPLPGAMTEIGLCAVAGLAVAWVAHRSVGATWDVLRVVLVATILGGFAGGVLGWALQHLWSDPGLLVFGDRRFVDELFTLPGFGVLGFVLVRLIPEIVHAQEGDDDGAGSRARGAMPPDTFHVRCLRCQTDIKVDRSMKRYRVATDRFEFACPNCQYWMEWADPGQQGAAAA